MTNPLVDALMAELEKDTAWQKNLTDVERQEALTWARNYMFLRLHAAQREARRRLRTLSYLLGSSPNYVSREVALRAWLEEED